MSDLNKLKKLANTVYFWGSATGWQPDELHETIQFALRQGERLEAAENRVAELEQWAKGLEESLIAANDRAEEAKAQLDELAAQEPVGEVILGEYDDCGDYPDAKAVCIAADGQADWGNFRNGTKLYTSAPPAPSVPPGWKMVPVEPTIEMYNAWVDCRMGFYEDYAAILEAAPAPGDS